MEKKSSWRDACSMSSSTRSNPASPDSPRDGDADVAEPKQADEPDDEPAAPEPVETSRRESGGDVEVELEVSRQRTVGWTVFGLIVGLLLIWKLGTVGVWVGILLVVIGAYRAWQLAQTYMHKPGTIV